jgi:MoaA/NifB/PqqE/SkfB family radical SAM enzyme
MSDGNGRNGSANSGGGLVDRARRKALEFGIAQGLTVLGKTPEGSYKHLASLLERAAGDDPNRKMIAAWVKRHFAPGHPGAIWLKRVLNDAHPNVRRRFWARLITHIIMRGDPPMVRLEDGREFPAPASIVISPTMRCNLRCVGCYAGNYTMQDDLAPEEVIGVIEDLRAMGTRFFVFSGGEPLIYKPLLDIVERFDDCAFQFFTSGHLIDEAVAKRIVSLGNVIPAISVEGFQAETDARRGPGGYERVLRAMKLLRDAGACFAFSVTATRRNIDTITSDAFAEWLVEQGPYYGFFFSYIPIGRAPDVDLMPTPEERNRLRIAVNHFRNDYPLLCADFWNDGALANGCLSGGRNYLHINSRGDVEPCVFAHFAVDNIRRKPLRECLASDYFNAFRKAAPYGNNLLRPCPIIDRPKVLRGLVRKFGAYATHDGGETIVGEEIGKFLDNYAEELAKIYDDVWAKEYRWAAQFHGKPEYDYVLNPPNGKSDTVAVENYGEPVVASAKE